MYIVGVPDKMQNIRKIAEHYIVMVRGGMEYHLLREVLGALLHLFFNIIGNSTGCIQNTPVMF